MTAPELLRRLEAFGVRIAEVGGELELDAPAVVLTPKVLATVREHKPALLNLLRVQSTLAVASAGAMEAQSTLGVAAADNTGTAPDADAQSTSEMPPALVERPGLELGEDGLWRWRGFIIPTRGTLPAYRKYFEKRRRRLAA